MTEAMATLRVEANDFERCLDTVAPDRLNTVELSPP
jgi:hypothetical protein